MHKFTRKFLTEWRRLKLPFEDETILVAVSGGADSVALTLALHELRELKKLRLIFIIAHFNHGLRGADADLDAQFVRELAEKLNFEFIGGIQSPENKLDNQKGNLEQSARFARYKFLRKEAEARSAFAVLTAHTLNDQAETLLLNLIRGSGIEGLSAMKKIRNLDFKNACPDTDKSKVQNPKSKIQLVRPLLGWAKREETEDFVKEKQSRFRRDSMNTDEKFSRAKIRKKIIPLMREINPKIVETLAQTAFLLQETSDQSLISGDQLGEILTVRELHTLSKPLLYSTLRQWLKMVRGDLRQIDFNHIKSIEALILSRKSGREVELPGKESIIKKDGKIFFEKSKVEKSRSDN